MVSSQSAKRKRIALLTSGGDGPGLNACIRAVVRMAISLDCEALGVRNGFAGLMRKEFVGLSSRDVGGILQRGGTLLNTTRCEEFTTPAGQELALASLREQGVDGLVVIGGNGSQRGAFALQERGFPVVGVPATIDNDVSGTDIAIGVDTALNTAVEAIDRIKDTATSHHRAFIIEVMGRDSGYLALAAGLASGADMILIPEVETSLEAVLDELEDVYARGKPHYIIVKAEGSRWKSTHLCKLINEAKTSYEARLTVLGHVQRGGTPSAYDRNLASRLGAAAVRELARGNAGVMVGLIGSTEVSTPLADVVNSVRRLNLDLYRLAQVLAR